MNFLIGNHQDKKKIYQYWKEIFKHDDGGHIDFYFNNGYDSTTNYLIKDDKNIASSLNVAKGNLDLNGYLIRYSFILGVFTTTGYRNLGYMDQLMKKTLALLERQDLVSILQAYNVDLYKKYGFEPFLYTKEILLDLKALELVDYSMVRLDVRNQEFLKLYNLFTSHFSGFKIRDYQYYLRKQNLNQDCGIRTALVVSDDDNVLGYMYFKVNKDLVIVEEIIYSSALVYAQLISYLSVHDRPVLVKVSEFEGVERIYQGEVSKICDTLIRVNDYHLLSKLLNADIKNVKELRASITKPIYFKEFE
ncbi:MAG: GNAT family N-acetyltransferase [Erysipelotrichaceae bacterium]